MKQAEPISMRVLVWMIVLLKQTRFVMEITKFSFTAENTFDCQRISNKLESSRKPFPQVTELALKSYFFFVKAVTILYVLYWI